MFFADNSHRFFRHWSRRVSARYQDQKTDAEVAGLVKKDGQFLITKVRRWGHDGGLQRAIVALTCVNIYGALGASPTAATA
jgi:hypothetical protein